MKSDLEQLDSKYPEMTKERLLEIILQQDALIQRMQERIAIIEQEIAKLKTQAPVAPVHASHVQEESDDNHLLSARTLPHAPISLHDLIPPVSYSQDEDKLVKVAKAIFHTSWMAILLGILIEIVIVVIASFGGLPDGLEPFAADLIQKTSWAFLVCIALTLATVTLKFRTPVMGIVGLLAAPAAFIIARALHGAARYALGLQPAASDGTSPIVVATIKSVQYGILGATLAFISKYAWGRALAHLWVGSLIAVLFGGALIAYSVQAASVAVPTLGLLAKSAGELIFPIGCALITFLGQSLGGLLPSQRTN